MIRYEDLYNRAGMLGDTERQRLRLLPHDMYRAIIEEHHRRADAIAEACERGEVIDYHDPRFGAGA